MGWERYLFMDWPAASALNELEEQVRRTSALGRSSRMNASRRVQELESDLARVALLARSLAELCLKKGVITPDELKVQLLTTDLDDGIGDQRLDPKVVMPGETKLAGRVTRAKPPPRKRR